MRTLLAFLGLGGIAYGLYNYFNKQLQLALDWDFKIKGFKLLNLDKNGASVDLLVSVLNKSSFALKVLDYDIKVKYKDVQVGDAKNNVPFVVEAESWFDVPTTAYIEFDSTKGVLDDFALAVLLKQPLFVDVVGDMNVEFGNIPKAVKFNVKNVQVSENVTESVGLSKPVSVINKFLDKLGIKI